MPLHYTLIALYLIAALSACAAWHDENESTTSAQKDNGIDQKAPVAKGKFVSELGKSAMYVFQAKNSDYWFGSNDRGVYRYDGKVIVNFTTKDGLCSNRIRGVQEDNSGNVYFTTYEGISKFDGKSFTMLRVSASSLPTDWKKEPDDL